MKEKRGAPKNNTNALGNNGGRKSLKVEIALLKGLTELNPLIVKKLKELIKSTDFNVAVKAIQLVINKQVADKHESELSGSFDFSEIRQEDILNKVKGLLNDKKNK